MIVAIGKTEEISSFRILGARVIILEDDQRNLDMVFESALGSRLVIIEEELYTEIEKDIKRLVSGMKNPPLFMIVPSSKGGETRRLKNIYELVSRAVGVRLKWEK